MDSQTALKHHKYKPIEVTTHNIYFHEDSPILSTDVCNGIISTCGFDGVVRLWSLEFKEITYKDNTYKTAANSSIKIEYLKDLVGFTRPINCVRFYKGSHNSEFILACCSDGGKVIVFDGLNEYVLRGDDGDDAYDLCWIERNLIIGFRSGNVELYQMNMAENENRDNKETENNNLDFNIRFKMILRRKIHDNTIQGIAYNEKFNLISTFSLDKTVKVHKIENNQLDLISTLDQNIDNSRGLFKRILFEDNLLYLFTKNNTVSAICYPFKNAHLQKKIGPLNSSVVKVLSFKINDELLLVICTKKSVYLIQDNELVCCVDNACYMAITDGFSTNNTIFLSSMDGFICTIRLNNDKKMLNN